MNTTDFRDLKYEKDGESGIVLVTLNTPKRKNAMSPYTFWELWWAVDAMEKDEGARAMILTGAKDPDSSDPTQEAFSSGGYFNLPAILKLREEFKDQIDFTDIAQKKLTLKMWAFDKPVIAAVNGLVVGGAFTMCLSCADLIYASEHAWAQLPFVKIGITPELASSYILPRILGFQKAKELIYFGERIPAQQLFELGLVNKVVPHDQLISYAREMALKLIPPAAAWMAIRLAKRALHEPLRDMIAQALDRENEALQKAFGTDDFREALKARAEKRPPAFQGR
jgi:2-(1,2-epoxy-1,2-dihydrophenyl)acetyl-CoA isomerase